MTQEEEETKSGVEKPSKEQVESETASQTGSETSSTVSEEGSSSVETSSTASSSSVGEEVETKEEKTVDKKQEDRRSGIRVPPGASQQRRFGGPQGGERDKELDGVVVEMRNGRKLFVDARENNRGKFIKLSESMARVQMFRSSNRRNDRITMRMKVAKDLANRLSEFIDAAERVEIDQKQEGGRDEEKPTGSNARPMVKPLHSVTLLDEERRYFIDLLPSRFKEREPVVRITMNNPMSGLRCNITVESGEVPYIKEALESVLEKCYTEDDEKEGDANGMQTIRFGRRAYHFQPRTQTRGNFIRITEVAPVNGQMLRSSLMVPDKVLAKFALMLKDYDAKMNSSGNGGGGGEKQNGSGPSTTSANSDNKTKKAEGVKGSAVKSVGGKKKVSKSAKVEGA